MNGVVIYTDLDGSLLDHHNYSHAPADALLQELEQAGIPVVPCTSKTRSELLPFREELDNRHPFIAENGAGVFIPGGYFPQQPPDTLEQEGFWVKQFVQPHSYWVGLLQELAGRFEGQFISFSQMTVADIVDLTGLGKEAAKRAAQREFGEPVHWLGSDQARSDFVSALQEAGAQVLQGGRFLHVSGDCDKGTALTWLHALYRDVHRSTSLPSLAIGDSQNDIAMLEAADHALVIRSPAHKPPQLQRSDALLSHHTGPEGWNEGVRRILKKLKISPR